MINSQRREASYKGRPIGRFFQCFSSSQFNFDRISYAKFKSLNKISHFTWLSEKFKEIWHEFAKYFTFWFAIALPCDGLVSKHFCFAIVFKCFCQYELRHFYSLAFDLDILLLLWFANINALSTLHVEHRFSRFY